VTLRQHSNVDKPDLNVEIDLSEPVALSFSLKYLVNFTKATGLSSQVKICLSNEVPLLVEYSLANNSYLRFYLAPKVQHVDPHDFHSVMLTNFRLEKKSKSRLILSFDEIYGRHVARRSD
jgi:DNA polymerase III sliding clamp (beta) subunit (PCNA family)